MAPLNHGAPHRVTGLLDASALYGVWLRSRRSALDLLEIRKLTPDRPEITRIRVTDRSP